MASAVLDELRGYLEKESGYDALVVHGIVEAVSADGQTREEAAEIAQVYLEGNARALELVESGTYGTQAPDAPATPHAMNTSPCATLAALTRCDEDSALQKRTTWKASSDKLGPPRVHRMTNRYQVSAQVGGHSNRHNRTRL